MEKDRIDWAAKPEIVKQIIELYNSGFKPKDISTKVNIDSTKLAAKLASL